MSLLLPVQYPVKYYSHLDAGAPQLADIDGNIKTILKAGLVTGIGTKAGAGWTSLFEDDFRIVLRRPLRTGNPPDIKIENGVINGTASHRIVSQDNPTGLNDATELAAVNLLARDNKNGVEWHLIVSDFGFILCYQMGENNQIGFRNAILYCGSMQKILNADNEPFLITGTEKIGVDGKGIAWLKPMLDPSSSTAIYFKDMRTGALYNKKLFITFDGKTELYANNDYLAQRAIIDARFITPFFMPVATNYIAVETTTVNIDNRPMLRYVNKHVQTYSNNIVYIPLDYWEL